MTYKLRGIPLVMLFYYCAYLTQCRFAMAVIPILPLYALLTRRWRVWGLLRYRGYGVRGAGVEAGLPAVGREMAGVRGILPFLPTLPLVWRRSVGVPLVCQHIWT